jgi:selenoprotein W-related protein
VSLADLLLTNLKQTVTGLEMVPSKGGVFEVDVDGERIWSKAKTKEFPDEGEILRQVKARKK